MQEVKGYVKGMQEAALSLVRTTGAASVALQMPMLPLQNDDGEELGLLAPGFVERQISPVALRVTSSATTLLVAASTLETLLGITGLAAVRGELASAALIGVGDLLFPIRDVDVAAAVGGVALLYRLTLDGRGTEAI